VSFPQDGKEPPMPSGDAAGIRETLLKLLAAYNAGDVDAITQPILPEWSVFGTGRGPDGGGDKERLKATFAAGFKTDLHWRHLYVRVYGSVAIASGYLGGTVHLPDGAVLEDNWRFYRVWIKREGRWQMAPEDELPSHETRLLPGFSSRIRVGKK